MCPKQGFPYYTTQVADPGYKPDNGTPGSATCSRAYPTYYTSFSTTKAAKEMASGHPEPEGGSTEADDPRPTY